MIEDTTNVTNELTIPADTVRYSIGAARLTYPPTSWRLDIAAELERQ
jgi:hypothetical protein